MPTASKIEEFLRNGPAGRLYVVVGYADVTGLAWLGWHAAERPVTLLVGDTRRRLFQGQPPDRRAALDLLARTDVDVLSGYRQGSPFVHQKVFVVASADGDGAVAGLAGSANLTHAGLFRNEETVVTVAWEELPAVWQQIRATCARGSPAGERIAGYIRDADAAAPGNAASRRNDPVGTASQRRPAPGAASVGGGRPPAQRTGGGRGCRRSVAAAGIGVALVGLLLLVGLCSMIRDRAGPSTTPAALAGSSRATSAEMQEPPQPGPDESDPPPIPATTVPESERSIEEPEQGENTVTATDEPVSDADPAAVEGAGDRRVSELDDAAVAALSVVVAAARSVYESEGDFGGASVAVLEGMGLAIPAPSELAQATGEEDVALTFPTRVAVTTPWEVSVLAPNPGESGALAVWAVAVRSPVACRAFVFDPDLGSWASMTTNTNCSGAHARNSYVQLRGVGGQRGNFHWAPATPDRITVDPAAVEGAGDRRVGELDDAAVAALSVVVAAARSVYESEGDFGGASVAVLEGMGLAIPAPSELAQATGEEDVALTFPTRVAVTTPWEVSVLAPNPGESGALAVWAVAVRSPVACRAFVFDPDLGSWASMTTNTNCSGAHARNSYVQLRGVGGQRGNFHWAPATPDRITVDPAAVEGAGDRRVGELDDAAVAALSVVVAAARSVYESEGDFGGASVAVLEGMGLAIPAPSELAQATGEEDVALTFPTRVAVTTPWEVSVLAPNPGESGALAVWAVAVRSPVACRAFVFDPDLGSWASMTTNTNCSGAHARNSYVQLRGVGGQRGNFHWAPATPDRITVDPAAVEGAGDRRVSELDDAAVAALSVVVAAARSVYESEGDFGGASVAVLEGMGLAIPAPSELAQATGEEDVALTFPTHVAVTTPWEVSV